MNRDDLVDVIGMIDDDMKEEKKVDSRMHCGSWIDSRISDCVC